MAAPVIVHINRLRCGLLGAGLVVFGLVTLLIVIGPLSSVNGLNWLTAICFLSGCAFIALGIFFLGVFHRKPVALRMDEHGVSGFYIAPARWDEIKDIREVKGPKRHTILGFELHDPIGFRDRQTPWQRLSSASAGKAHNLHLLIPRSMLSGAKDMDLVATAHALKSPDTVK